MRFFFYSNEGSPREPLHIHANKGSAEAKIWLEPHVGVASSDGFSHAELRDIVDVVRSRRALIESVWNDHFSR